ncbi:hypothetical protein FBQ99_03715 [Chloroflexi bacterium CFX2]|nr:hypothetical protein [Chloroflexi bacterium CFX2]
MKRVSGLIFSVFLMFVLGCSPAASVPADEAAVTPPASPPTDTAAASPITDTPSPTTPPQGKVEDLVSRCPTAEEIASVNADLTLQFDHDPTAGTLVCTAASGSADLTRLQERTYQAVLMMKKIKFDEPLPWTDLPLYDWFVNAIDGIRFRGDIEQSSCCEPANFINVQTENLAALQTNRWLDPGMGAGLQGLLVLYVHEARHNEGFPHTCGVNDNTIAEMGAWGVQYHLLMWFAYHTDRDFFSAPDAPPTYYQEMALSEANWVRGLNFCAEPTMTPGPTPTLKP